MISDGKQSSAGCGVKWRIAADPETIPTGFEHLYDKFSFVARKLSPTNDAAQLGGDVCGHGGGRTERA